MAKYSIIVEFTRIAEISIEADNSLDARSKIGNYEFDPDIIGELTGWRIIGTKMELDLGPAVITEESALSLARKRTKTPRIEM